MMQSGTFLTACWRYLAMLNYEVDPAVLRPHLPRGTELDAWQGKTYLSVVGFLFLRTRLLGWAIPFHQDFEEVNLRFYVRRLGPEGWRRGVVFLKEIVPRLAVTAVARGFYNEQYVTRPMRHDVSFETNPGKASGNAEYAWRDGGRWNSVAVMTHGDAQPLAVGSLDEFIAEHYWGYVTQRDGGTVEYQVEHPPWRAWAVDAAVLDCDVAAAYGKQFVPWLGPAPPSALLAEGSPVSVRWGQRLLPPG